MSSIIFHAFVVLGISFVMPDQAEKPVIGPPLKITLVSDASELAPEDSTILAQQNSLGEEDATATIPTMELTAQASSNTSHNQTEQDDSVMDSGFSQTKIAKTKINSSEQSNQPFLQRDKLTQSINLAYLNAQAKPREKYVSAKAKESIYAAYIEKWRLLVERVGNLNYPEIAKQQQLQGTLVLDVAIKANGEVDKVRILQSSDVKVLDDAAERIVHIASPFDRFPEQIRKEVDVLHIVRTWEFVHDDITNQTINLK